MLEVLDLSPSAGVRQKVRPVWRLMAAASFAVKRHGVARLLAMPACVLPVLAMTVVVAGLYPHAAVAQSASRSICIACVDSSDITDNSITSADIKNGQVKRADIANNAVNSKKIANITRSISLPATALSHQVGSNIIAETASGLRWKPNFLGNARLTILKPADYAGGDAKLRIFFVTTTATAGAVDFFVRPDSFDAGGAFRDISSVGAPAVLVSGKRAFGNMYEQPFRIPKRRMQKDWWTVNIQRQGTESTYPDDVVVMSVALEYRATQ